MKNARICEHCGNLVTLKIECPLCNLPTEKHPDADEDEGYCVRCGDHYPAKRLTLITWEQNPYIQSNDGDLYTECDKCLAKEAK